MDREQIYEELTSRFSWLYKLLGAEDAARLDGELWKLSEQIRNRTQ